MKSSQSYYPYTTTLINYTKSGEKIPNWIRIYPLYSEHRVSHFLAIMERLACFPPPSTNLNVINTQLLRSNFGSSGGYIKASPSNHGVNKRSTDSRGSGSVASGSDGSQSYNINPGSFPQSLPQYNYFPSSFFPMNVHPSASNVFSPSDLQLQQQQQQNSIHMPIHMQGQYQQQMQNIFAENNIAPLVSGTGNGSYLNSNQIFFGNNAFQFPNGSTGHVSHMMPQPFYTPVAYNIPPGYMQMVQIPPNSTTFANSLPPLSMNQNLRREDLNCQAPDRAKIGRESNSTPRSNDKETTMQLVIGDNNSTTAPAENSSRLAGTNITAANNVSQQDVKAESGSSGTCKLNYQENTQSNLAPPPVSKISLAFRQRQAAIVANSNNQPTASVGTTQPTSSSVSMAGSSSRFSEGSGGMSLTASTVGATTTSGHSHMSSESSLPDKEPRRKTKKQAATGTNESRNDSATTKEEEQQLYYGFLDDYNKSHPSHSHRHRNEDKAGKGSNRVNETILNSITSNLLVIK
jgi:hypothetical protein